MIKAIETEYNGYRFRSRLEARWAVLFDALGIKYEYEKEGYNLPNSGWYLPDFWLPETQTWVEVKGDYRAFDFQMLADAVDWGNGLPYTDESLRTTSGLLLLGNIPEAKNSFWPVHLILQHSKGGWVNEAQLGYRELFVHDVQLDYFDSSCNEQSGLEKVITKYWSTEYGMAEHCPTWIVDAYKKARSARFEFGQTPVIK